MATERRPTRPTTRVPQPPPPASRPPTGKAPMRDLPPHMIKLSSPEPAAPPPKTSSRPITRSMPRGQAPRTSRSEGMSTRSFAQPRKSNMPLILGGVGGGVLLLIVIIAVAVSGGSSKARATSNPKPAGRPVDVAGLERDGEAKCQEGLALIQRCEGLMTGRTLSAGEKAQLKNDLEKGVNLIKDGMNRFDEANAKSGNMYDTTQYGKAYKAAKMKLGELGGK